MELQMMKNLILEINFTLDPSQYPSNKPSTLSYLFTSVDHYDDPSSV